MQLLVVRSRNYIAAVNDSPTFVFCGTPARQCPRRFPECCSWQVFLRTEKLPVMATLRARRSEFSFPSRMTHLSLRSHTTAVGAGESDGEEEETTLLLTETKEDTSR